MKPETLEKIEEIVRIAQDLITLGRQDPDNNAGFDINAAIEKIGMTVHAAYDLENPDGEGDTVQLPAKEPLGDLLGAGSGLDQAATVEEGLPQQPTSDEQPAKQEDDGA